MTANVGNSVVINASPGGSQISAATVLPRSITQEILELYGDGDYCPVEPDCDRLDACSHRSQSPDDINDALRAASVIVPGKPRVSNIYRYGGGGGGMPPPPKKKIHDSFLPAATPPPPPPPKKKREQVSISGQ